MHTIELDASSWKTPLEAASALKAALGSPDWHGTNAVAFVDSMVAGGVNALKLRIPIYSGRVFRREAGHRSDLKPATIPK